MKPNFKQPIDKNVKLTEQFVNENLDKIKEIGEYFINYPDLYLDWITPKDSNFQLFFYQRIFLRAAMRYTYFYATACRALSKTFLSVLSGMLRCIFLPGEKFFIVAPKKDQAAKISQEKIDEILGHWPLLKKEIVTYNKGKDYTKIVFRNGSMFDVVGALDSQRGSRRHAGMIDEVRDHDADLLNEVVIPLMNVSRRDPNGYLDPTEPNQAQLYLTSAGSKGSFAYSKLIEIFIQSIIDPDSSFIFGCDYRVPMKHGLISRQLINKMKMDSTMKEDSFAREYLSIWTGSSEDSWISWDKLAKYRTINNPHKKQKIKVNEKAFYLISVDVARTGVLSSVQVFKAIEKSNHYQKQLVNSIALCDMHFSRQSMYIKRLIRDFKPKEVIVDGTGVGLGLVDFLVMDQYDEDTGELLPTLSSFNETDYAHYGNLNILYVLKASSKLNSEIHSTFYSQIMNGYCRFLISEEEAKQKLMSTAIGQKMRPEDKLTRLFPHRETQALFDEIGNLRLKLKGEDLVIERMNTYINKDRFSAAEYGIWRIKQLEDTYFKEKNRKQVDFQKFVFFTKGGHH